MEKYIALGKGNSKDPFYTIKFSKNISFVFLGSSGASSSDMRTPDMRPALTSTTSLLSNGPLSSVGPVGQSSPNTNSYAGYGGFNNYSHSSHSPRPGHPLDSMAGYKSNMHKASIYD